MKPRCGINPISHGWLLNKHFILSKGNSKQNKTVKIWPWDMGIYSMAISQSEHDKIFLEVE